MARYQSAYRRAGAAPDQDTHGKEYLGCDRNQRDQGKHASNEQIVEPERPAGETNRVKGEWRIVVADQTIGSRIDRQARRRSILEVAVPSFGRPYLDQKTRPPDRPRQKPGRGHREQDQIDQDSNVRIRCGVSR